MINLSGGEMTEEKTSRQFIKFVLVGLMNTAIDWISFFLLKILPYFLAHRPLAKAISFLIAATNSFIFNSRWTFKNEYYGGFSEGDEHKTYKTSVYFGRFLGVSLIGWFLNTITYTITISLLPTSLSEKYIDIIALFLASGAGIIWNFLANKFWTYQKIEVKNLSKEESKKRFWFNLIGILLLGFVATISIILAKNDSGTVDEVAHIPSGYSYVAYNDFRLNPEHPPLAKAVSGIPLLFTKNVELTKSAAWDDINQWEAGWDFIYRLGNDADQVLFLTRLPMIILLLILGIYLYKFAAELFGRKVAVLVLTIFAFYPDLLAHGHLVTTDIAAALGFTLAIYYFYHYTKEKSKKSLVVAGIAFGIAQLLKFSSFLLIPIFFIYALYLAYRERKTAGGFLKAFWPEFKSTLLLGIVSLFIIYFVYLPFVWNTPSGIEHQLIESNLTNDIRTLPLRNFLHFFENSPLLRAIGHYILGVFLVFGRVGGGNSTYILGHFSDKSISWYFPVAWLLKTPLPIILLCLSGITTFVWGLIKRVKKDYWISWLILTPIVIYWLVTLKGSLNIGIRHLMPTIPFVLLFIGYQLKPVMNSTKIGWQKIIVGFLVVWLAAGTIVNYPNYISYFNELTFGMEKHDILVDSSLDWGQDLKRLQKYVEDNNIESIKIDYFGGSVPEYYIPGAKKWRSGYGPTTGYLAVSATFFQFSKMVGVSENKWSYDWLEDYQPKAIIGNSILVFYIDPDYFAVNPPTSSYPILKFDIDENLTNLNQEESAPSAEN
jgi:putative flippase GtrA